MLTCTKHCGGFCRISLVREPRIRASIGGVPVFECQYGTHNNKYAIRIEQCLRSVESNWTGEK